MRYPKVNDGEWVQPRRRGYKMACCDCGLVHRLNFRIVNGRIQFQASRDNRATGAVRRPFARIRVVKARKRPTTGGRA